MKSNVNRILDKVNFPAGIYLFRVNNRDTTSYCKYVQRSKDI